MKNDIRVVRKAEPLNGNRVSNVNGTRSNRQRNLAFSKREHRGAHNSPVVDAPKINSRSGRPIKPNSFLDSRAHVLETVVVSSPETNVATERSENLTVDNKRRRTNAQSYINKRFLYDVTEPPKRSRQQKSLSSHTRSPAALMAVSSANLKRQRSIPTRDHSAVFNDQIGHQNKRGRPLKQILELNAYTDQADNLRLNHTRGSRSVRNSRLKSEDISIANQGSWDARDLYGGSSARAIEEFSLSNAHPDSSLQKYADPADMTTYSGVLLNVFDNGHSPDHGLLGDDVGNDPMLRMRDGMSASRTAVASSENVFRQPSETGLVGQSRNHTGGRRVRSPLRQTDAAYLGQQDQFQSVFSTSQQHNAGEEDRTADLLSLYSEVHSGCFSSQSQLNAPSLAAGRRTHDVDGSDEDEELDAVVGTRRGHQRYTVSSAAVVGGGRSSEPDVLLASDDLDDEEDLLSPELSILAGCSAVAPSNDAAAAGATGSLMEAGTETGLAVTSGVLIPQAAGGVAVGGGTATTFGGGSSRRKSPVRPMQVIRTKSHSVAASAPTANAGGHNSSQKSPSLTGGHLEPSSLILTSSLLKCASPSVPAFCRRRASEEADSSSCNLLEHHQQVDLSKATPVGASVIRLVPGHPPVVQTFPTAPSSTSAVTAASLPGRPLISTNQSRLQTASSPVSETGDYGQAAGGLLISATCSSTGAHTSRLLVNSGSSNSTTVTRSAIAAASAGSNGSASAAVAANPTGVGKGISLLSASTATSGSATSAIAPRRRPTILKRLLPTHLNTSASAAAATGLLRPSLDAEFPPPPLASQTVAASVAVDVDQHHHQLIGNGANTTSSTASTTVTTVAQGSAPTKLLQLVTAPLQPSHPPASSSSASSSSSSSTSNCYAASTASSTLSMTASDRLFGRRPAPPISMVSAGYHHQGTKNSVSTGSATAISSDLLVDGNRVNQASSMTTASTGGNTFNSTTPYRYAVVRGSADGKRYLVLGNHGVFDRNVTSVNGNTLDSSSLVSSSSDLPGTAGGGATGSEQQILPLDPFLLVDTVNSTGVTEEDNTREFAPTVTTGAGGNPSPSSTGRTLIRRSKGSKFTSLIVTPLPPVSACAGDVAVATAVT